MASYRDLGVSSGKEEVHAAVRGLDKGLFPGAFCRVLPDVLTRSKKHGLIIHADGAGTKSSLAYMVWKETGNLGVFAGIAQDSMAMNIDDMLCVGATGPFLFSNTIGRNAKIFPGAAIEAVITGYQTLTEQLARHGIEIHVAGGETADVGDLVRTAIVDSTFTARIPLKKVIDCSQVQPGHVIVGFASDGQASYEDAPNSGMGSNGLTAARHNVLHSIYRDQYPETFAPEIKELAYSGRFKLDDRVPELSMTVGEAVLSPTRLYAPMMRQVLHKFRPAISAIFHNTGGGQAKCLSFGEGVCYEKTDPLPLPPFFRFLQEATGYSLTDMARTFNLGSRMEVVCDRDAAAGIIAVSEAFNIQAKVIGEVTSTSQHRRALVLKHGAETVTLTSP